MLLVPSIKAYYNGATGNYIKDSIFIINKNKKMLGKYKVNGIYQDAIGFNKMAESRFDDNKQRFFILQCMNMFQQLKKEENNKLINYGTKSQGATVYFLKTLERKGYINIIANEINAKKNSLLFERIFLGLKKRDKKITMHNIVFTLSDKKFDRNSTEEMANELKIDTTNYYKLVKNNKIIYKINKKIEKKNIKYYKKNIPKNYKLSTLSKHYSEKETIKNNDNFELEKQKNREEEIKRNMSRIQIDQKNEKEILENQSKSI